MRDWVGDPEGPYYLLGSVVGPHPYPWLVRELQAVIGREARAQLLARVGAPDVVVACVGGGSNAIGLFHAFLDDTCDIVGIEAGGVGDGTGQHAATIARGRPGVLHGCHTMLLQDAHGQVQSTRSISAGLDYSAVGPEHAYLHWVGRVRYESVGDEEALAALDLTCLREGILPALESSHAIAGALRIAARKPGARILVGVSGRGDKDLPTLLARGGAR
jgi:tryptophan synthase beta chain